MKNTLITFGIAGLAAVVLSSFVMTGNDDNVQKPKKSRHVRMVKVENGKKMEIDTVFTTDDVFVWQGDTINPVKHKGKFMVHSFGKGDGKANVMVFKHKDGKKGDPMFFDMEAGDDMDVVIDSNDSTGKKIIARRIEKGGPANHMIFRNGRGPDHFPPVPPVPHIMKFKQTGKVIDLNDPNVISYKKKDLSGGREKIEIVRKKADSKEEAVFDFRFEGDDFIGPEPPEALEFSDFDNDSLKLNIIEKEKIIDGKDGKEIEVKVESPENK